MKRSNSFNKSYELILEAHKSILDNYDRELALIIFRGQLFKCDSCHADLAKYIASYFDDIENDELLCLSYYVGDDSFLLIHEGYDFTIEDLNLINKEFNCSIYLEGSHYIYKIVHH